MPPRARPSDFAAAVDKSGAQLRAFNAEALPKLQDKLKQLKDKKGWDEEKALDACATTARPSSTRKPRTSSSRSTCSAARPRRASPDCASSPSSKPPGIELLAVMKAKSTYTLAKLDDAD